MSWWIDENFSYTKITDTETPYDERLANICADDFASLPAYNSQQSSADNPFILVRGSKAFVLSTSKRYMLNSQNQWVEIHESSGGGASSADQVSYDNTDSGLTATNVQDAIDELKDTDDTQDNALVELSGENANQQLEINYAINTGSKNLLKLNAASQTINGVTFTVNDDQTITVNGTATSNADFSINTALSLMAGSYILSGCPSGGSGTPTTYKLQIQSIGYDTGNGLAFNLSAARNANVYIRIWSGYTANNIVFRPMIRRAEITDDTFVPYAPTNRELYETKATIEDYYGLGTQITTNGTLDITQLGRFYCANAATAATITNAPWTDAGFFGYTERSITTADRYIQIAFRNDDSFRIAKRRYIGTWQPWSYIDTYDEGNLIPDNANLNDYIRGGKYYGGNSAGASVSNLPVANASFNFSLEVKNASPIHTLQYLTILRAADDPYIYKRRYYNGTWSSWYRFEGTEVASASVQSVNQVSTLNLNRNDINESLDTNFDLIDSIPEEEEGEEDV